MASLLFFTLFAHLLFDGMHRIPAGVTYLGGDRLGAFTHIVGGCLGGVPHGSTRRFDMAAAQAQKQG